MSEHRPFDAGLQIERTALSWRRTALSVAIGSLVALRALPEYLGSPVWVIPGVVGVLGALVLWWTATVRYRRFHQRRAHGEERASSAAVLLGVALTCAVVGAASIWLVTSTAVNGIGAA